VLLQPGSRGNPSPLGCRQSRGFPVIWLKVVRTHVAHFSHRVFFPPRNGGYFFALQKRAVLKPVVNPRVCLIAP